MQVFAYKSLFLLWKNKMKTVKYVTLLKMYLKYNANFLDQIVSDIVFPRMYYLMYYPMNQWLGTVHSAGDLLKVDYIVSGNVDLEPEEQVFISFICG